MKLTDIFNAASIAFNWDTYVADSNEPPYIGEGFFPAKKKAGLDLKFIKGSSGLPISLQESAFDAHARLRDRIGISTFQTEMPFFREGFLISEQDRQDILRAQESNDPYALQALQRIYDDSQELIRGANVVPERMRMQLLAPVDGALKISMKSEKTGADYEYNFDADGSWKATNYKALTGTASWSDTENSDPLSDIEDMQEKIEELTGVKPDVLLINKSTMKLLRDNKKMQAYIQAKNVAAIVRYTSQSVKDYLNEELDLTVVEYNKKYLLEKGGEAKNFYPDGYATLLPSTPLGNTYYGTTPEEADLNAGQGASVAIVNTGVAVTVINKAHPVTQETIASEIVLPSFEGMDKVAVFKAVDPEVSKASKDAGQTEQSGSKG